MPTDHMRSPHDDAPVDASVFDLLSADHRAIRRWFELIDEAEHASLAADRHRRGDLIAQLCGDLTLHLRLEEALVYPALRSALRDGERALLADGERQHAHAKQLIEVLRDHRPDDPATAMALRDLRGAVEAHVMHEEQRVFPLAAPRVESASLGRQMRELRREILVQRGEVC